MRLLIPTGGSTHSEIAVKFGVELLHCRNLPNADTLTLLVIVKQEEDHPKARQVLGRACELLAEGFSVETKIRIGQ